ncbi:unnamed protein product [Vicia faba]|uniref:Uncharacterized protein n=1 Tax=Vicia faba TaxID=3906 RepID=A0AAV0ZW87_VICFA|nr:unnamed protein product [Vicia faba]
MARPFDNICDINEQKDLWKLAVRIQHMWTIVRYCLARMDTKLRFKIVWDREAAKLLKTSAAQLHSIMIEVNSLLSQRFDDFRCVLLWACFCRFRVALVAFDNSNNRGLQVDGEHSCADTVECSDELRCKQLTSEMHLRADDCFLSNWLDFKIFEREASIVLIPPWKDTSTIDLCKLLKDNLQMDEVKMRILFDKETCMSHIWLMVFRDSIYIENVVISLIESVKLQKRHILKDA